MRSTVFLLLACSALVGPTPALGNEPVLFVAPGAAPGDVELEWAGGQPPFRVFRGEDAASVPSPARQIGQTSGTSWIDTPPGVELQYYRVTGRVAVEQITLSYGPDGAQALDLYMPRDLPTAPMPTVVLAHGGLWQSGDKSALATLCENVVTESGGTQACASINYRLSSNLGGTCFAPGVDTYVDQVFDLASAYAFLQSRAATSFLDTTRMYVGGHSAGGHLSHELNLRWADFGQPCSDPSGCPPAAGAIGFEGIYDIEAWDDYDDSFWSGQFFCATRRAFGFPPDGSAPCVDADYDLPCWHVGSPAYLAQNHVELGVDPVGAALIIHSPGDNWVDIAEATNFAASMSAAFPAIDTITSTDGSCATGQHNDPLTQIALATCIVNFVASRGSSIW